MTHALHSYRTLQWSLIVTLALHNAEEATTFRAYLPDLTALAAQRGIAPAALPDLDAFYLALLLATLLPFLLVLFATTGPPSRLKRYLVAVLAGVLLLNVFLPHVPAAVLLGGYAPGLVTAVFVNLPLSLYFFRQSLREAQISRKGLAISLAAALVVLSVPLFQFTAAWILQGLGL